MIKRIGLFLMVNIAVMVMLNVILRVLGLGHYLTATGINYPSLMVFCLVWGMGGAFISLMLSKFLAKRTMGLRILDPESLNSDERRLVGTVHRLAQSAGLEKMPEVGVYSSPEVNAFATGPSRNNSLVAVSTGLLSTMTTQEVDGVLGHEVSHIANGDMVTMTLVQGVMNAFVLFFAKAIAWAAASAMSRGDQDSGPSWGVAFLIEMVLQVVFGLLAAIVVAWFSRYREFRADAGAAELTGSQSMIRALTRLQQVSGIETSDPRQEALSNFKISGGKSSFLALLSSHPPLDERIAALQRAV